MNTIDINRFLVNALVLYSLKTPENQRTFGVFRGYEIEILASHTHDYLTKIQFETLVWRLMKGLARN